MIIKPVVLNETHWMDKKIYIISHVPRKILAISEAIFKSDPILCYFLFLYDK